MAFYAISVAYLVIVYDNSDVVWEIQHNSNYTCVRLKADNIKPYNAEICVFKPWRPKGF